MESSYILTTQVPTTLTSYTTLYIIKAKLTGYYTIKTKLQTLSTFTGWSTNDVFLSQDPIQDPTLYLVVYPYSLLICNSSSALSFMVLTLLTSTSQLFVRTLLSLVLSGIFSTSVTGMNLWSNYFHGVWLLRGKRGSWLSSESLQSNTEASIVKARQRQWDSREGKRVHLWMWAADWPTGMEAIDGGHFEDHLPQLGFQKYFRNLLSRTTMNLGNLLLSYWTFLINWNFFKIGLLATALSTSQGVAAMGDCREDLPY